MAKGKKIRPAIPGTPGARRRELTVALITEENPWVRAEARARGWRLLHLEYCGFVLPPGPAPGGALVDLPTSHPRVQVLLPELRAVVRLGTGPDPGDRRAPAILPDQAAEGRLAAEHFAERGLRHIAYVGSRPWGALRPLAESFAAQARELGMAFHLFRVPQVGLKQKADAFASWLRDVPKPLGLLAPTDERAARYASWAAAAGCSLPTDVAILGRGNRIGVCEGFVPSLSSIDTSEEARSRAACDLLARLMAGERPPREPIVIPPAGIVERESTHLLAVPDPHVAAALRYLWDHLDMDISVDAVARRVGVSRRKLERAFQRHLHRGINEELRRKRLEVLCRLLRTTDHSIADLASAVGFHNMTNLYNAFRAAHGMTPRQYRLRSAEDGPPSRR